MAVNQFTSDATCLAVFKFETVANPGEESRSGLHATPTVTLSMSFNPAGVKKEGDKSLLFDNRGGAFADSAMLVLKDATIPANFPGKAALVSSFTVCLWLNMETAIQDPYLGPIGKWHAAGNARFFQMNISSGNRVYCNFGHTNGTLAQLLVVTGGTITPGQWYHVGAGYDTATATIKVRVYDDTAGSIQEKTFSTAAAGVVRGTSAEWTIGAVDTAITNAWNGRIDELAIFNSFLVDSSIDSIRMGKYYYSIASSEKTKSEQIRLGMRLTRRMEL